MSLIVKQKFVCEDIIDENGNKLGEIRFNPSDSRIIGKLTKIVKDLTEGMETLKNMGDMPELTNKNLEKLEDFEKYEEDITKLCDGMQIEADVINGVFEDLYEIFGKETIDIITLGTQDVELLNPLLDFILPYIGEARQQKVDKYLPKTDVEVLE